MGILFIDLGEVRTFELNGHGARTIGRDAKNDIVITHPTVSRHHARIEPTPDGSYVLIDFNSRNGTRVNGRAVASSELLHDGARMRIGHVRAWFFRSMPGKLPRSISNRDRGIIFKCECGQRLWSASDTAGMSVTCGGCNKSIEVPDSTTLSSAEQASSGTVAGVSVVDEPTKEKIVCGVCQWPVEKDERAHKCPACGLDFHIDCWIENQGCSAYGCSQVNLLAEKVERPAAPVAANQPISSVGVVATEPAAPAVAWAHAILAMSVVSALLGLLSFGLPCALIALVAIGRMIIVRDGRRLILTAAILIAVVGMAAGYMISRFWWLNEMLFAF
jgi:uncharacterized CHY-type Zn-finger protein